MVSTNRGGESRWLSDLELRQGEGEGVYNSQVSLDIMSNPWVNPLKPIWGGNRCFWMIRINSWCFQYLCSNWCTVEVHLK